MAIGAIEHQLMLHLFSSWESGMELNMELMGKLLHIKSRLDRAAQQVREGKASPALLQELYKDFPDVRKQLDIDVSTACDVFCAMLDIDMNAYMRPMSGTKIYIYRCTVDDIKTLDISYGMCHEVRFCGQTPEPMPVASHLLGMLPEAIRLDEAHNMKGELIRAWLLHDADEAYLGDFPRPVKEAGINLPHYLASQHMTSVINKRYGITDDVNVKNLVKYLDEMALENEQNWRFDKSGTESMLYLATVNEFLGTLSQYGIK